MTAPTRRAARGALVGATASSPAESDPVLALVVQVRAAWERLGEVLKEAEEGGMVDEAHCPVDDAMAELLETPPTTLAGAHAAIAWLVEYDAPNVPKASGKYLRTLLRSPVFPDPIFAAIEKHQAAVAAFHAALERATKADDASANAACEAEIEAMGHLLDTGPATLAVRHLAVLTDGCLPQDVRALVTCLVRSPLFAA